MRTEPDRVRLMSLNRRHTVAGMTPTHYRVSHFSDFRDAQWVTYAPTPVVQTQQSLVHGRRWPEYALQRARLLSAPGTESERRAASITHQRWVPQPGSTTEKTGGGTVTVQPDFTNSNIRNRTLHVVFAS